jgi:hypothetical protein
MSIHNFEQKLKEAPLGVSGKGLFVKAVNGCLLAWGTSVPSAAAGYAVSGLFVHTDAAGLTTSLYTNTGSTSSCTFTALAGTTGAYVDATYAAAVAAAAVVTGATYASVYASLYGTARVTATSGTAANVAGTIFMNGTTSRANTVWIPVVAGGVTYHVPGFAAI